METPLRDFVYEALPIGHDLPIEKKIILTYPLSKTPSKNAIHFILKCEDKYYKISCDPLIKQYGLASALRKHLVPHLVKNELSS